MCSSASTTVTESATVTGSAIVAGSATGHGLGDRSGLGNRNGFGNRDGLGDGDGLDDRPRARPPRLNICSSAPSMTQHEGLRVRHEGLVYNIEYLTVPAIFDTSFE